MPQSLSKNFRCAALDTTHCLLQMPKAGSSSMKLGFQLPLGVNATLIALQDHPERQCQHVLTTFRDPVERFISGLGTIYHRLRESAHRGDLAAVSAGADRTPELQQLIGMHLNTMHDFEVYAALLIRMIDARLKRCESFGVFNHLYPQALYAALVPDRARLYAATVEAMSRAAVSKFAAVGCAPLISKRGNNAGEGNRDGSILHGLSAAKLPPKLHEKIVEYYTVDYHFLSMTIPSSTRQGPSHNSSQKRSSPFPTPPRTLATHS